MSQGLASRGIGVALAVVMTMDIPAMNPMRRRRGESVAVLRWVFLQGTNALTCAIRVNGAGAYDVCVVPHWDVSSSVVERHTHPVSALHRHAEIAWHLRQAGWSVIRDTAKPQAGIAA